MKSYIQIYIHAHYTAAIHQLHVMLSRKCHFFHNPIIMWIFWSQSCKGTFEVSGRLVVLLVSEPFYCVDNTRAYSDAVAEAGKLEIPDELTSITESRIDIRDLNKERVIYLSNVMASWTKVMQTELDLIKNIKVNW